ncbi:hypothetical protein BJX63DRAFT_445000 [Aspergillus granulosus]|uniref:Rad21/Rec8-like protein C-terminal eukaryotic domain-containing protein n=1 Tax=Aspergillus granulosus TaxID=176169 RepID=A0ABR4HX58_9EURO
MFYSHEILTSPEHGVATVWLDYPGCGCSQGMQCHNGSSCAYGAQASEQLTQCGYTLLDVQAMHDKMKTMLRSVSGGGLDPFAKKQGLPDQLILPYDPAILPEDNLPGLAIDLTKLTRLLEVTESQQSSFLPQTPDLSQSAILSNSSLGLDLPSDGDILGNVDAFSPEANIGNSVRRRLDLTGLVGPSLEDGDVLLEPDFEFDENGNIVELGARQQSEARTVRHGSEMRENETTDFTFDDQLIHADEDIEMAKPDERRGSTQQGMLSIEVGTPAPEAENADDRKDVTMRQRYRAPKLLPSDGQTALHSFELAQMNNEYMRNMAVAAKQKRNNRIPTQAKKNAAYWVFGIGIGCVGSGIGTSRAVHPLHIFSGDELYEALAPKLAGHKRSLEDDQESQGRRVRAREGEDTHIGMGGLEEDNNLWNEDVELGRYASPALQDDNSSQMPWNITASIQSSHQEKSVNIFRGFGNVSDISARGIPESAGTLARDASLRVPGRAHSRLTSASPLAGRGFPYDGNQLNIFSVPGQDDDLEGFDLTQYLEDDAQSDSHLIGDAPGPSYRSQPELQSTLTESVMDQEGLNFLDFLAAKVNSLKLVSGTQGSAADNEITFSILLPPQKTSRTVATQGLMHILALTTQGFLSVRQDAYVDHSTDDHGVHYEYGEIYMHLAQR